MVCYPHSSPTAGSHYPLGHKNLPDLRRVTQAELFNICDNLIGRLIGKNVGLARIRYPILFLGVWHSTVQLHELLGTSHWFNRDRGVVPPERKEVLATGFQNGILEGVAVAILTWVIAVDHPA